MAQKTKDKIDGIRVKVFVNLNGNTLLCRGRMEFLEEVDREGSISKAAENLEMSYRKAWNLVKKTNEAAGFSIIEVKRGGQYGGSAFLTEKGKKLLESMKKFMEEIEETADRQTEILLKEIIKI